jgi:AcrR family transcriptional regulator
MIEAAADSILAQGYPATTIAGVAHRAGVAVQTVYFTFHTKAALFMEVVIWLSAGSDAGTPVMERPWVREAREAPAPQRTVALMVEHGTDIFRRLLPVWPSIQAARASDEDFATRFGAVVAARRNGMRALIAALAARRGLRRGVSVDQAAETFFLLQSPELLSLATTELGWPLERFKAWTYVSMLPLLATSPAGQPALRGLSFGTEVRSFARR